MTEVASHFDADTALEPAGDGRWRAWAPDHWFVGRGPNGGFLAALAARAAEEATGRPLRSLALHFVAAPAVGPLEIGATLERAGRSYSTASLRLEQDERPMMLGLATLGALPADGAAWDAAPMPVATPVERTEPVSLEQAGIPAFMRNYDMRWALGSQPGEPPASGGWIRTTEPRALDAPLVAAMTDAWAPGRLRRARPDGGGADDRPHDPHPPAAPARRDGARGPCARPLREPAFGGRRMGGGRRAVDARRRADRPVAPARARAGAGVVSRSRPERA